MAAGSHFNLTEIVIGAVALLAVAVFANSHFNLGVGFLYDIEEMVVPGGGSDYDENLSIDYEGSDENCKRSIKVFGENKRVTRNRIRNAEADGRTEEAEELRAKLEEQALDIKSMCP